MVPTILGTNYLEFVWDHFFSSTRSQLYLVYTLTGLEFLEKLLLRAGEAVSQVQSIMGLYLTNYYELRREIWKLCDPETSVHVEKKEFMKNYNVFIIRLELDEISAKTRKYQHLNTTQCSVIL